MPRVTVYVRPDGRVETVYSEASARLLQQLDATTPLRIARAGEVDPDVTTGRWWIDLKRLGGPLIGPFAVDDRAGALALEQALVEAYLAGQHWDFLNQPPWPARLAGLRVIGWSSVTSSL